MCLLTRVVSVSRHQQVLANSYKYANFWLQTRERESETLKLTLSLKPVGGIQLCFQSMVFIYDSCLSIPAAGYDPQDRIELPLKTEN